MRGVIKWYSAVKGYGFISPEGGGRDVFVHVSAVEQAGLKGLRDGQAVEFELVRDKDGRTHAGQLRAI